MYNLNTNPTGSDSYKVCNLAFAFYKYEMPNICAYSNLYLAEKIAYLRRHSPTTQLLTEIKYIYGLAIK